MAVYSEVLSQIAVFSHSILWEAQCQQKNSKKKRQKERTFSLKCSLLGTDSWQEALAGWRRKANSTKPRNIALLHRKSKEHRRPVRGGFFRKGSKTFINNLSSCWPLVLKSSDGVDLTPPQRHYEVTCQGFIVIKQKHPVPGPRYVQLWKIFSFHHIFIKSQNDYTHFPLWDRIWFKLWF